MGRANIKMNGHNGKVGGWEEGPYGAKRGKVERESDEVTRRGFALPNKPAM